MSNQWGRDRQPVAARGGSAAPVILALALGLAIGGAAGYGSLRYLSGDTASRLAAAEQRNMALSGDLADIRQKLQQALAAGEKSENAIGPADGEAAELQKKVDLQRSELDAMTDELARISDALQAEKDRAASLSAALGEERTKSLSQAAAVAEAQKNAADAKARADAEIADLQARLSKRENDTSRDLVRLQQEEIPRLNRQIAELTAQATASGANAARALSQQQMLEKSLASAEAELTRLRAELGDERRKNAMLAGEIERLKRETSVVPVEKPQSPSAATARPEAAEGARDPDLVEAILADTPGVDRLTSADRIRLRDMLVSGQCVTTALRAVFPSVPVVTLRDLMRDLKSNC